MTKDTKDVDKSRRTYDYKKKKKRSLKKWPKKKSR